MDSSHYHQSHMNSSSNITTAGQDSNTTTSYRVVLDNNNIAGTSHTQPIRLSLTPSRISNSSNSNTNINSSSSGGTASSYLHHHHTPGQIFTASSSSSSSIPTTASIHLISNRQIQTVNNNSPQIISTKTGGGAGGGTGGSVPLSFVLSSSPQAQRFTVSNHHHLPQQHHVSLVSSSNINNNSNNNAIGTTRRLIVQNSHLHDSSTSVGLTGSGGEHHFTTTTPSSASSSATFHTTHIIATHQQPQQQQNIIRLTTSPNQNVVVPRPTPSVIRLSSSNELSSQGLRQTTIITNKLGGGSTAVVLNDNVAVSSPRIRLPMQTTTASTNRIVRPRVKPQQQQQEGGGGGIRGEFISGRNNAIGTGGHSSNVRSSVAKYDPRTSSNVDVMERTLVDAKLMFSFPRKPKTNLFGFWSKHFKKRCETKQSAIHSVTSNATVLCNDFAQFLQESFTSTSSTSLESYPLLTLQLHQSICQWRDHLRYLTQATLQRCQWYNNGKSLTSSTFKKGGKKSNKKRDFSTIHDNDNEFFMEKSHNDHLIPPPPTKKARKSHSDEKSLGVGGSIGGSTQKAMKRKKTDEKGKSSDQKVSLSSSSSAKKSLTTKIKKVKKSAPTAMDLIGKKTKYIVCLLRTNMSKLKPALRSFHSNRRQGRQKCMDRCRFLAKECMKLHREVAKQSLKCADAGVTRGRRLGRDIARKHFDAVDAANRMRMSNSEHNLNGSSLDIVGSGGGAAGDIGGADGTIIGSGCGMGTGGVGPGGATGGTGVYSSAIGLTIAQEERLARKRAEKAEAERRKAELELWEAQRQQRKLNFLIKRTELYAHFMAKKASDTTAGGGSGGENEDEIKECETILFGDGEDSLLKPLPMKPGGTNTATTSSANDIDNLPLNPEDDEELQRLKQSTITLALNAVHKQHEKTALFDRRRVQQGLIVGDNDSSSPESTTAAANGDGSVGVDNNQEESLAHAQLERGFCERGQPKLFRGTLKPYQLKGMNWLLNLYEQGINGILADEMGLGKTVQTIATFAALTEPPYNLWGPYLIITPNSTLHNWVQELRRFVPELSITPYWGSPQDRKKLRCRWSALAQQSLLTGSSNHEKTGGSAGSVGGNTSPLHVVVTNYPVVVEDHRMLAKIPWQYMVLDEAQAIKSTASLRWNILLSFECRNRLLLSGTPIQNTMRELWALLHFIMPSLFDNHEEFNQWFSRDIESQAAQAVQQQTGGSTTTTTTTTTSSSSSSMNNSKLDENQLRRLHMILKPFMLRRVKSDVESELLPKVEIQLVCPLSARQRRLYDHFRQRVRLSVVDDLCVSNSRMAAERQLCNIVMELRKVCNHPDLCHRREPIRFAPRCNILLMEEEALFIVPRLFFIDGLLNGDQLNILQMSNLLQGFFYIFSPTYIHNQLFIESSESCAFAIVWLLLFTREISFKCLCESINRTATTIVNWNSQLSDKREDYLQEYYTQWCRAHQRQWLKSIWSSSSSSSSSSNSYFFPHCWEIYNGLNTNFMLATFTDVMHVWKQVWRTYPNLLFREPLCFTASPPPTLHSNGASFSLFCHGSCRQPNKLSEMSFAKLPSSLSSSSNDYSNLNELFTRHDRPLFLDRLSFDSRIADSGKLLALDNLLRQLRLENEETFSKLSTMPSTSSDTTDSTTTTSANSSLVPHKVLLYSQMTRVLDILEEYMRYRGFAYVRLDGSCRLLDRNEAVVAFQNDPKVFVFLLSTRAGGLGINLTAANVVVFYDSDWNPTVDQQAMDRAHRFGQLRQVTVYRLVCGNSIEQRMLQCASQKQEMQRRVIADAGEGDGDLPKMENTTTSGGGGVGVGVNTTATPQTNVTNSASTMSSKEALNLLLLDDEEMAERLAQRRRNQPTRGRPPKYRGSGILSTVASSSNLTSANNNNGSPSRHPSAANLCDSIDSFVIDSFSHDRESVTAAAAPPPSPAAAQMMMAPSEHDLISRKSWALHKTRGGGRPRKYQTHDLSGVSALTRFATVPKITGKSSSATSGMDSENVPSNSSVLINENSTGGEHQHHFVTTLQSQSLATTSPPSSLPIHQSTTQLSPLLPRSSPSSSGRPRGRPRGSATSASSTTGGGRGGGNGGRA